MKFKPRFNKDILNQPFFKGITTGLLLGVGTTWTVLAVMYNLNVQLLGGLMVFIIGSIQYLVQIRKDYNFIN